MSISGAGAANRRRDELRRSIEKRGLLGTAAFLAGYAADLAFDWRYGTDTVGWAPLDTLRIASPNRERGIGYQPTQVYPLRRLFAALRISPGATLLDLGCGKGRVLLIGASFGLGTVRGVEFSPELCAIARHNVERYRARSGSAARFEIVELDAADYAFRDDEDVIFLFHPFDAQVLRAALKNLEQSLDRRPRPLRLVYRNPVHGAAIEATSRISRRSDFRALASEFAVFTTL